MRTIAIINQKGGCGKTTVSLNLASALAVSGQKTLLVDIDPQSHCAVGLAVPEEQVELSIYDVLVGSVTSHKKKITEILWQISDNFEMAPASLDLAAFEQQMAGISDRENCLSNVLAEVSDIYDYVIIDCPPSVGLLTFNALRAADDVIVPVDTGYFSLHGLGKQLDTINFLSKQCNHQINVMVLASMYDIRTKMAREILAELRRQFADKMFKTTINFNTKLKEAASLGQPVCEYDPSSKGSKDFQALAQELVSSNAKFSRDEIARSLTAELDAISESANELLEEINPQAKQEQATEKAEISHAVAQLETRLDDFYGSRQIDGKVIFSGLYPRAEKVEIAGDFNGWTPEEWPMQKVSDKGHWQLTKPLHSGTYKYRLVVDGLWQQDPYNERAEINPFGEFNSLLEVKQH